MSTVSNGTSNSMRAVTMRLGDELFAVEAESVREILEIGPITSVPNAPDFVGGLINVRGTVVPLADLRVTFNMPRPPHDNDTRILVMEIELDGEPAVAGILADKVHDVADLDTSEIETPPKIGMRWRSDFVRGIGKRGDDFIIIPDMNRIFSGRVGDSKAR